jgi:hypothetical protein
VISGYLVAVLSASSPLNLVPRFVEWLIKCQLRQKLVGLRVKHVLPMLAPVAGHEHNA